MKRYLIAFLLLTIMNISSETVAAPGVQFSSKCNADLEDALKVLNKELNKTTTLQDLRNKQSEALTFKNHFFHTQTWGRLVSVCAPIHKKSFDCTTCTNAQCNDPSSNCWWSCFPCPPNL